MLVHAEGEGAPTTEVTPGMERAEEVRALPGAGYGRDKGSDEAPPGLGHTGVLSMTRVSKSGRCLLNAKM